MQTSQTKPFDIATHNGVLTIENPESGEHRTVKIVTDGWTSMNRGTRWVKLLVGPDNNSNYVGFARVVDGRCRVFRRLLEGESSQFYERMAKVLNQPERFTHRLNFHFEGRCIRCNRRLTTPESIERGVGPECAKKR